MQRYYVRVGRPVSRESRSRAEGRSSDSAFSRAGILALCGAFAVVSFFAYSLKKTDGDASPDNVPYQDSAVMVSAQPVGNPASEKIGDDASRAFADDGDTSVWSYIEGVLRKLFSDESD